MVENMTNEQQLKELERDEKIAKVNVDLGNALDSLRTNRHFNKIIVEGYFKEEAIRLVHLKADPAMQCPEKQAAILREMDAIGSLASYLTVIDQRARMAGKQLKDIEVARTDILEGNE